MVGMRRRAVANAAAKKISFFPARAGGILVRLRLVGIGVRQAGMRRISGGREILLTARL
jgi:hypothetical protein